MGYPVGDGLAVIGVHDPFTIERVLKIADFNHYGRRVKLPENIQIPVADVAVKAPVRLVLPILF